MLSFVFEVNSAIQESVDFIVMELGLLGERHIYHERIALDLSNECVDLKHAVVEHQRDDDPVNSEVHSRLEEHVY